MTFSTATHKNDWVSRERDGTLVFMGIFNLWVFHKGIRNFSTNPYLSDAASSTASPRRWASLLRDVLWGQTQVVLSGPCACLYIPRLWDCWKCRGACHLQEQPGKSLPYPFGFQIYRFKGGSHSHSSYSWKLTPWRPCGIHALQNSPSMQNSFNKSMNDPMAESAWNVPEVSLWHLRRTGCFYLCPLGNLGLPC